MSKYDIKNKQHLSELDGKLTKSMFLGGDKPSSEDREVFQLFGDESVCASEYPGIAGWYFVIRYFTDDVKKTWGSDDKKGNNANTKKEPTPAKNQEDDDDLFGSDDETEEDKKKREEKKKQALEEKKKANAEKAKAKEKSKPIAKSLVILDVKVHELETDFDALAKKVLGIQMDGLTWKTEYKLADIAFGMKKLVVGMVVEDEKVSVDDVSEKIEAFEDLVQSVDIVSFDKI